MLGNKPASGTDILVELGEEHISTGALIVYTSGDSVFQIAAHEDVWPLDSGWRERLGLWQLQPLRVHAILFGGYYGAAVERTAARYA